jgi:class 3 adenylate cyclase
VVSAVNVVVMFTDLVGSTALSSRVGPEAAEVLRVEHFALLRSVVEAHDGREVKNLGDGVMVVFGAPSSALAAAVEIQQRVEARNTSSGSEPFGIRVGVAAGEADEDDGDVFGRPVVEAARLCALADGGEVLTTGLVRLLVGSRGQFEFVVVGQRELKGLDEAVEVVAVSWVPLGEAEQAGMVVELPARLAQRSGQVFAGRSGEMFRWAQTWKGVRESQRGVWLVGGEAGIGKTTLVSEIARRVHGDGAVVVYGRCDEDLGVVYQPWAQALSSLVTAAPAELLVDHVEARGAELLRLAPELGTRTGVVGAVGSDLEAERYALFGAVVDLLARVAARVPLMVVLDDLHWADQGTVHLLRHLAGVVDPMRVAVVVTYRPTDITVSHPLAEMFASLRREPGVEFVDLVGLDDAELLELMEVIAGHEMDEDGLVLRDTIAAETAGNPFFVTEVLRHLAESGTIVRDGGRWVAAVDLAEHGLPVSVRQVVGQRVARLGEEAERVLRVGAVIGRDFELGVLVDSADVDTDAALDVLDAAVAAGLVHNVSGERFSFAHALVEHALYQDVTPARRARLHHRVAIVLEARYGLYDDHVAELAHHWMSATASVEVTKAVGYAQRAGDLALAHLAPDEAVRWYTKALDLLTHSAGYEGSLHVELLVGLGDAQRQVGDPSHRDTLLDAAHRAHTLGARDQLVRAALANHRGFTTNQGAVDHDKVQVLYLALDAVGHADSTERARLLAVLASELAFGDQYELRDACEEAVAMARRLDEPETLLTTLVAWHSTRGGRSNSVSLADQAQALFASADEAMALAQDLDDHVALTLVAASTATHSVEKGDRRRFEEAATMSHQAASRVGHPTLVWRASMPRALLAIIDGDLTLAERLAEEVLNLGLDSNQPDAFSAYGGLLGTIRYCQGRLVELEDIFEESLTETNLDVWRAALTFIRVQTGDLDKARADLASEVATDFSADHAHHPDHATYLALLTEACARLDQVDYAPRLLIAMTPFIGQIESISGTTCGFAMPTCAGMLEALLGHDDRADHHFGQAIALTTGFGAPHLTATAQLEWGHALLRRTPPRTDQAEALLSHALTVAEERGFDEIRQRSHQLLSL